MPFNIAISDSSQDKKLKGIITDGDLRRAIEKHHEKIFKLNAKNIMTQNPRIVSIDAKAIEAEELCNKHKITSLIVTDEKQNVTGVFQIYNLSKVWASCLIQ